MSVEQFPSVVFENSDDKGYPSGKSRYVLLRISDQKESKVALYCIQSHASHKCLAEKAETLAWFLLDLKLSFKCLGGGFITGEPVSRKYVIGGTSETFGQADHQLTAELLRSFLPADYTVEVK